MPFMLLLWVPGSRPNRLMDIARCRFNHSARSYIYYLSYCTTVVVRNRRLLAVVVSSIRVHLLFGAQVLTCDDTPRSCESQAREPSRHTPSSFVAVLYTLYLAFLPRYEYSAKKGKCYVPTTIRTGDPPQTTTVCNFITC